MTGHVCTATAISKSNIIRFSMMLQRGCLRTTHDSLHACFEMQCKDLDVLQVSWLETGLHEKKMHEATMAEPFANSALHAADEQGETQMLHAAFARCATAMTCCMRALAALA